MLPLRTRISHGLIGALAIVLVLFTPAHLAGQFPVVDGTNYVMLGKIWHEDVSTGSKIFKEFQQLVKIYQTDMASYQMSVAMAQMLTHPQRAMLLAAGPAVIANVASNRYGETMNWPGAMNGNTAMSGHAWASNQTVAQNPYLALERLGQSYLLAKLARSEQIDGANQRCTQVISDYYAKRQMNQGSVQLLKQAGLDVSKTANAVVSQLNLENSHHQQALTEAQFQGNLHACQVEQAMLASATQRDEAVQMLNFYGDEDAAQASQYSYMGDVYGPAEKNFLIP